MNKRNTFLVIILLIAVFTTCKSDKSTRQELLEDMELADNVASERIHIYEFAQELNVKMNNLIKILEMMILKGIIRGKIESAVYTAL